MKKGGRREKNVRDSRGREVRDSDSLPPLLPALALKSPKGERSLFQHKQEKSFARIQDGARTKKKKRRKGEELQLPKSQILISRPVFTRPY